MTNPPKKKIVIVLSDDEALLVSILVDWYLKAHPTTNKRDKDILKSALEKLDKKMEGD